MDVIVVVAVLAFFAIAAGYVVFCERSVGSGDSPSGGLRRSAGS